MCGLRHDHLLADDGRLANGGRAHEYGLHGRLAQKGEEEEGAKGRPRQLDHPVSDDGEERCADARDAYLDEEIDEQVDHHRIERIGCEQRGPMAGRENGGEMERP